MNSESFDNDMYFGDDGLTEKYIGMKLNEDYRSAGPATLAKIEQKQESGKTVLVIDTGSPLSKSTVEKVKKMISSSKQKPAGEEASKQEQIEEFLKKYKTFNDVPVKDMRHIIPLLLMEVYVEKHGQYTKKVKGLWEKRPDDWPDMVPFVDPNNRLKNDGVKNVKPKKELLGQMLTYLVDRYTKMKSSAEVSDGCLLHANDPLLSLVQCDDLFQYELNLVETNDNELRAAEQSVSDQSLSTGHSSGYPSLPEYSFVFRQDVKSSLSSLTNDGSMNQSSLSTIEDLLSGAMNEGHGELVEDGPGSYLELPWIAQPDLDARPPEQVVDNEEETSSVKDWNPIEEIHERTRLKLGYMRTKGLLPKAMQDQLEDIHGLLKNLLVAGLDEETKLKYIEDWYQLEMCIDIAKFQQPKRCSTMLQELHGKLSQKIVQSMDLMADNTVNSKNMNLSNPVEDAQQFNSLLNIRPRPGPAGGMVPFPTVNQLEVRCLDSKQSAVNDDCRGSMLSDNRKPIQLAQEDGEAQKSEKREDNLAMDESLPLSFTDEEMREFFLQFCKPELSCPVQESAPVIQSASQLVGKLEMPVGLLDHVMTSVSVQPWASATPAMMMSAPVFPAQAVRPSQLISNPSVGSPSTAYAEECMNRLSLSVNYDPFPQQLQKASPHEPMQPMLDQLLCKQRAAGRSGGKRCLPIDEDNESGNNITGPSRPAKVPAYNTMIPLVVEEISNNPDKPFPRLLKKKSR